MSFRFDDAFVTMLRQKSHEAGESAAKYLQKAAVARWSGSLLDQPMRPVDIKNHKIGCKCGICEPKS